MSKAIIKRLEEEILSNFEAMNEHPSIELSKTLSENNYRLLQALNAFEQTENKRVCDLERLQFEKEQSNAKNQIEKDKSTWSARAFEMVKVLSPLALSLIGYGIFQTRVLRFEENGRFCTFAARELHLPKFMNK